MAATATALSFTIDERQELSEASSILLRLMNRMDGRIRLTTPTKMLLAHYGAILDTITDSDPTSRTFGQ